MPAQESAPARPQKAPAHPAELAAALMPALATQNLIVVVADEPRGRAVSAALAAMAPDATVLFCPGSDALPGESSPSSPANAGQRVAALHRLHLVGGKGERRQVALVATGEASARLYPAPQAFDSAPPIIRTGDEIVLETLAVELAELGYLSDDRVDEPGEIGMRGQVIDIYPADAGQPYRIEAHEGRVTHIRPYDPATQRTTGECEELEIGRAAEPALGDGVLLIDHLPDAALLIEPQADVRRTRMLALADDVARRGAGRAARDMAEDARWRDAIAERTQLPAIEAGEAIPRFVEKKQPLKALVATALAARQAGERIALLGSARDLRFLTPRVAKALKQEALPAAGWAELAAAEPGTFLTLEAPAERGFRQGGVLAIAAADLLGSRAAREDAGGPANIALFDLGDIAVGDVAVHEDHGLGVVDGLEEMPGGDGDAIALRYAEGGRRLVPVAEADRIWRYGADPDAVTLDRLDGHSWEKRRGDIDAAVAESARGLIALAAERAEQKAPVLEPDTAAYERFAAGFPYLETPDQARAIEAVRADLASGKPMDRLVIGDVGYGKTEVALRAAALAALSGMQVALAAPTTVLARQHIEEFTRRFEGSGIAVAGLSRLSSAAEKKAVKAGLADGSIGVVVGTGAVAGKGVDYAKLGLVIVDEEQRFGTADKDRLRGLGAGHLLTLSATPIPRTLQGALVGLRGLSIIATPPARRQPIRTSVAPFDGEAVRTALIREKGRGGQSFVVVPRIEDMEPLAGQLGKLAPELEVLQAHGKMPAAEIDEAMVRFGRGDGDVLLATNIIEAGLDVPRANTMVISRADRFGLSQLHQLRGRVGRGARRGQVLLLTDAETEIAPRTLKRLRTLEAFDRLGAGFAISARDLDMRGAGDLLGEAQAGHMKLIGIDLYQHLLAAALARSRGEEIERWTPELHLGADGRLPPAWIPEPDVRVTLYARLSRIADAGTLDAFEAELEDRFGELPDEARQLLAIARIRVQARAVRIARVDAGPGAIALTPRSGFAGDFGRAGLEEDKGRLLLHERITDPAERLHRVVELMEALEG